MPKGSKPSRQRAALLEWTACIGAVTAEALAYRQMATLTSARGQLLAAERAGLMRRLRPLAGEPSLYAITRAGLRACKSPEIAPCRIGAANGEHLIACAWAAATLERCYPDHRVFGEPELRRVERGDGAPVASARMGTGPDGRQLVHRPDLVLWPHARVPTRSDGCRGDARRMDLQAFGPGLPVAVEVELTTKAPQRLAEICRAWARCRSVAGVIYLAAPRVEGALERAIDRAHATERIVVVPLAALPRQQASPAEADEPSSAAAENHPK
jgi:hypothetical protein